MGNVARVFLRDVKRLAKTPAAWSVMLFLAVLPSLYTWFNVSAFWNPYDNTGNLSVSVVNEDVAVQDETLGSLNLGAQLVDQLHENKQLGWEFVDRDTALENVRSGHSYAAFVIPSNFSANVTTLLSGNFQQPTIEYYVNEKTGPVSPKITDTGANALDTTINDTFFSTVSSTVVATVNERLDKAGVQLKDAEANAVARMDSAIGGLDEAHNSLNKLKSTAQEGIEKTQAARRALESAKTRIDALSSGIGQAADQAAEADAKLLEVSGRAHTALDGASGELAKASAETTLAITRVNAALEHARTLVNSSPTITAEWTELRSALDAAAQSVSGTHTPVEELVNNSLKRADEYRNSLSGASIPSIGSSLSQISSTAATLETTISSQMILIDQTSLVLDQLETTLSLSADAINNTDGLLSELQGDLSTARTDLIALQTSNALGEAFGESGLNPDQIADFMKSPTQVEQVELYPLNAYGSAMAPLFLNLTLWIGVFMLMVIVRLEVDDEGIEGLTITQRFLGRSIILAIMAALQASICCAGCIMLGVQTANVALFFVTAIIASLAYLGIQYTLSATLQHVGKALCIILIFVQIPGGTGLYPIEMTPEFFRVVYPLFPFTYGINAIRETISGFYQNAWGYNISILLLFFAIFAVIGIVVRPYMTNLNRMFARQIEESDIVNGEAVHLPARRYRMSAVIKALANHEEYRDAVNIRVTRFIRIYPHLKTGALAAGIIVPLLTTAIMSALHVDKVIVLTSWLIWLAVIVFFLLAVEYTRDYLSHLVSLETMSADDVKGLFAKRNLFTKVKPISDNLISRTKARETINEPGSAVSEKADHEGVTATSDGPASAAPVGEAPEKTSQTHADFTPSLESTETAAEQNHLNDAASSQGGDQYV